jgi:ankyrin repeat protein
MKRVIYFFAVTMIVPLAARAADGLTQSLQHGLFEEEANQNLDAAIKAYQSVLTQADEQRKVVATALFRLGECYSKLGKTNEATAQYQRILRDFSEQEQLVKLSRENVGKFGGTIAGGGTQGQPGLIQGLEGQELARIRAMVKDSPDLLNSRQPSSGDTPLHLAAQSGNVLVVEFLLTNGANVNVLNNSRWTPLHVAVALGNRRIAELLLAHGGEVDRKNADGATPLFLAADRGYLGIVQALLDRNADVNAVTLRGAQPLHASAANGYTAVAEVLLDHGAELERRPSINGSTPLSQAADRGNIEMVKLLLKRKANVNSADDSGATPVRKAAAGNWPELVKVLLDAGADPKLKNGSGQSALFGISNPDVIELLLTHGTDPNEVDRSGYSALAQLLNHPAAMESLLNHGANPNFVLPSGVPALFSAVIGGQQRAVELLLEHGANPNVASNAETPLSLTQGRIKNPSPTADAQSRINWERIEKLLRDHGANENFARFSRITYTRPGWSSEETWRTRDTNDFNRYTLFELIGSVSQQAISFADLAHITIVRFSPTNSTKREIQVNLDEAIRSADCSKDFWLDWGDRVVIPERDHELAEGWKPPRELREFLRRCLTRQVEIIVKETTNLVELVPTLYSLHELPAPQLPSVPNQNFSVLRAPQPSLLNRQSMSWHYPSSV